MMDSFYFNQDSSSEVSFADLLHFEDDDDNTEDMSSITRVYFDREPGPDSGSVDHNHDGDGLIVTVTSNENTDSKHGIVEAHSHSQVNQNLTETKIESDQRMTIDDEDIEELNTVNDNDVQNHNGNKRPRRNIKVLKDEIIEMG